MKTWFYAALAALALTFAVVPANARDFHNGSNVADDLTATRQEQTGSYSGN